MKTQSTIEEVLFEEVQRKNHLLILLVDLLGLDVEGLKERLSLKYHRNRTAPPCEISVPTFRTIAS